MVILNLLPQGLVGETSHTPWKKLDPLIPWGVLASPFANGFIETIKPNRRPSTRKEKVTNECF